MYSFHRAMIAVLFAATLAGPFAGQAAASPGAACYFGECAPGASAPATEGTGATERKEPSTRVVAEHGSWMALASGQMLLIVDRFQDGLKFAIAIEGDSIDLLVTNPKWGMKKGAQYTLNVRIDDRLFSDPVVAVDATTLVLKDVSPKFVAALYRGGRGSIAIGSYHAEMTALTDAAATLDDAVRYQKASVE